MTENKSPPEVVKIFGPPGTGKTTTLIGLPEEDVTGLVIQNLDKYSLEDQLICTYTKAATEEAIERLYKFTDEYKYVLEDRIRTIHSHCFQTLDLNRSQVVQWSDKSNFCNMYDLKFEFDDDQDDLMSADLSEGNALFRIYEWLVNNRMEFEDWEKCPANWDSERDIIQLFGYWEDYKEDKDLIQFCDMIEEVVKLGRTQLENLGWGILFADDSVPDREMFEMARKDLQRQPDVIRGEGAFADTRILYVDEAQDLTRLQFDWYLLQKLVADEVYLAGDPNQTIYGWSGADPRFMLDEEGETNILDKTYRLPSKIWNLSDQVIQQCEDKADTGGVEPRAEGGNIEIYEMPSGKELIEHIVGNHSVFILFRARYMINEFNNEILHPLGIPYDNMSTFDTWDKDTVALRDALGKLANNKKLSGEDINNLKIFYDGDVDFDLNRTQNIMDSLGGLASEKIKEKFQLHSGNPVREYLDKVSDDINYYQRQAILGNIRKNNVNMYPERVKIGTIHSAKGREADTVILATDSTKRILSNMSEDTEGTDKIISDAERRVYYVGMTRAKEELVLAEGIIDSANVIPLDALLADYQPDHTEQRQRKLI